jgi:hypothetical protein
VIRTGLLSRPTGYYATWCSILTATISRSSIRAKLISLCQSINVVAARSNPDVIINIPENYDISGSCFHWLALKESSPILPRCNNMGMAAAKQHVAACYQYPTGGKTTSRFRQISHRFSYPPHQTFRHQVWYPPNAATGDHAGVIAGRGVIGISVNGMAVYTTSPPVIVKTDSMDRIRSGGTVM